MTTDSRERRAQAPSPTAEQVRNLWLAGLGAAAAIGRRGRALFAALVAEGRAVQARARARRDGDR
ncbi:MAG: phasin family protein [Mizugakiibacter sp.]|uniref:phasin family protein n=1 Tax=Mizugakiibacter sp. TaxID=1972610 RepID=UPI0031CA38DB|nr:phasin family protein [Xanthomonadaceae bacterium]